jgi:hypothetical protein
MYIRLITLKELSKEDIKFWYKIVKELAPDGVISSIQVPGPKKDDGPKDVYLIKKKIDGKFGYEIPLSRDLVEKEIQPINDALIEYFPEGDFKIETSAVKINKASRPMSADATIELKKRDYNELCDTLAKNIHQRWCSDREKAGWKFGLKLNKKEKTHPMLRPWDQLNDEYKNVDYDLPKLFMEKLSEYGFVVVKKTDLARWLK